MNINLRDLGNSEHLLLTLKIDSNNSLPLHYVLPKKNHIGIIATV